jgi:hypothetical protein
MLAESVFACRDAEYGRKRSPGRYGDSNPAESGGRSRFGAAGIARWGRSSGVRVGAADRRRVSEHARGGASGADALGGGQILGNSRGCGR